ncbi:MAG: sensor domain-containing diguanylate cyclase [Bacillota bacterium]
MRPRGIIYILFTWMVIVAGTLILVATAGEINLDVSWEMLVMAALWLAADGLSVSLPQGQLSAGWAVALTLFFTHGFPALVWTGGVVTLLGQRLFGRGDPWRTTLFNAGQCILAFWLANYLYLRSGGLVVGKETLHNTLSVLVFTATYVVANHTLVYLYLLPRRRYHPLVLWREALKWDTVTYLFGLPLGYVMLFLWKETAFWAAVLIFVPVLILQFVLRLYVVLTLTNRELNALYHVARRLGESVSLDKTLDFILTTVKRVVSYRTGVIFIWSDTRRAFVPGAVSGPYAKSIKDSVVGAGEGFIGWVAETREPEIIHDTRQEPRFTNEAGFITAERSLVAIPLVAEDEVLGVFILGERRPYAFDERCLSILTIIGGQAAVAIRNTRLFSRIEELARADPITGVLNRRYFLLRFQAECERALNRDEPLAVIIADIDDFSKFNDTYGPLVGDAALREVARVIRNVLRGNDLLARFGGDEYIMLLPGAAETVAQETAERLRGALDRHIFGVEGVVGPLNVKISLGVAVFPSDAATPAGIVQKVGRALKLARIQGGNTVATAAGVRDVEYFH